MKKTDYKPIDCNYYDELVLFATRKERITIAYQVDGGPESRIKSVIRDVYTKEGEEFLILENGKILRLDQLISAGGKKVPTSGS